MRSFRTSLLTWFYAAPLLFTGVTMAAESITITNPGFESPTVAEEDPLYNALPAGWFAYNGAILGSTVYAYNPSAADFTLQAPEGFNIIGISGSSPTPLDRGITQTLTTKFKEGGTYQLSVKVGYTNAIGLNDEIPGYRVQLLAGTKVIAEDNNSLNPPKGSFYTSTINYVYDPILDSEFVNQDLQIRLINKNLADSNTNVTEVAFDDVKLFEVLANPYADVGGPYYMPDPVSSQLLLNASASLPSGNETITLYEWDLDNDGDFDITGVTPAAISYLDLQTMYNMKDGSNAIRLRVTDSALPTPKSTIATGNVELVTSTKYTGPNGNRADSWSVASNWDNGIPQGVLDVVILASKNPIAWGDTTPTYTGNLTLLNNAVLSIGYGATLQASYNALGTPGITKIFMNPGSSIGTSTGGTPVIPEIQLLGNAAMVLGSSTGPGANMQFNYPISGPYQLFLQGNSQAGNIANFNVPNTFNAIYAAGAPYVDGGLTIRANAAGSLGTGNITIDKNRSTTASYAILEINAANAMADTATLSIGGTTGIRLRMNANDTIAALILNGVVQAAGTYNSSNSSSWLSGSGTLTVGTPSVGYWDINGTTAGAGGISPSGTWNAANTLWNNTAAGTGSVAAWTAGRTAIFSAGNDATGTYAVDVVGTQDISGLVMRNGSISLTDGGSGNLRLTANGIFSVGPGSSSITTPISQDGTARSLTVLGTGAHTLSGNLSYTGGTSIIGVDLMLSGNNNSVADGATNLTNGVLRVTTPNSIPGTQRNVTINSTGTLVFGPSFGSIQTALNTRIVTTSAGTIAADNNPSENFDFTAAGLTAAYFGSLSDVNYTGNLTPQGSAYRLRSNGGTLTMANTDALSGARTLTVRGDVVLAANNSYTGATTVETNSLLSILGTSSSSGITLNTGSTLTIGSNASPYNGTLTITGLSTLKAVGTVVTNNAVAANSDFHIAGIGNLTVGNTTINANRVITNNGTGITTFGSIVNGAANLSLTIDGSGNTAVSGNVTLVNGNFTKNGSGTLTLNGANTYSVTTINGGILRLNGSTFGAGFTNIFAAGLQLGSNSNGGLPTGNITISNPSAFIQAVDSNRSISNNIILGNNVTFSGSYSLTINGKLTNNIANRTLTNNIISTKVLTLGNVDLSENSTNRILSIGGPGNTTINGIIQNGGGSTVSSLTKSGSGILTLNGANTYAGPTTMNANSGELVINGSLGNSALAIGSGSKLFINGSIGNGDITLSGTSRIFVNGSTGTGNVIINSGATLLGSGTIGGNTYIGAGGKLEFNLFTPAAGHDKLELASGKALDFSGTNQVIMTGNATIGTYTLLTAPGGITGPLPALILPSEWVATLAINGNDLQLNVTYSGTFPDPPTLVSIADDKSGGPVDIFVPITYTVTFNEDMNESTVTSSDFSNAGGTANIIFDSITEIAPGVFTLQVTPTTPGTLQLRINQGATLRSALGLNLNTTSAITDDNILNIAVPADGVLAVTSGDFSTVKEPGGPFIPLSKTYTLSNYGNQPLNWSAAKTANWIDLTSTSGTLAANGGNTTVTVSVNAAADLLALGSYFDTVTFTNTTIGPGNGLGNTSRGVSLAVNGEPVVVTLSNLNQTYNGTPKAVTVTTNPVKTFSLTYNGLEAPDGVPTDAGSYDIVATVTESGYTGSATGTLVINKASQTITFAALETVGDDASPFTLTATSTSNLPITFTSSNSDVATVNGDVITIVGVGTTTITASQAGDENYNPAASVGRSLIIIRTNPLAVPGGPYLVSSSADLALDGSGSLASNNQTISAYEWDLDDSNDDGGATFTANVSGPTPTAITMATLQASYGMIVGSNPIRLRITDTANKTSIVSTTVQITAPLRWDSDGNYSNGQTDGAFDWFGSTRWRDVGANVNWADHVGKDVIFGNASNGGAVTLPAPTSVGSITINAFNTASTYTLGSASQTLTINRGITKNANSGAVNFISPLFLGADQTWSNSSTTTLNTASSVNLSNRILTISNTGAVNLSNAVSGSGTIIKSGSGRVQLHPGPITFTGGLTINQGHVMVPINWDMGSLNLTLNNGTIETYWGGMLTRTLGSGPNQFQILGGISGFAGGGGGVSVRLTGDPNYEVVWGSQFFNPTEFELGPAGTGSGVTFDNKLDLNGADRTLRISSATVGSTVTQIIRNSSTTPAGLIKTGPGLINLNNANTYDGGTTLQAGTLQLGNVRSLGSQVGTLTVNGGLLNINNQSNVTVGNLTGTAGTIANNGANAQTFIIGNGGGTGGNFQGAIANNTNAGTGTLALTKNGTGNITLSGVNTYTGNTNISKGKLFINGTNGASNISVASGSTFGGTGAIGGNITVAAGGKLEFNLSTVPGSHDPLNIATGKAIAFSGASELKINLAYGVTTGTYVLVTGGNNITGVAPATLTLPLGCTASVSIVGNELRLVITAIGDVTPPSLNNITDNLGGDNTILIDSVVTYTVSFDEDIDASTISVADFTNAGTSAINIGTITETSPGIFTVPVTPTTAGTLQLRIPTTAVIQDISGNSLVTSPAIDDGTTVTVTSIPFTAWSNAGSFNTDTNNDGVPNGLAWLLGANDPSVNARAALPAAVQNAGNIVLTFRTLRTAARGTASIKVQYSKDLGVADFWANHEIEVPGAVGTYPNYNSSGVDFVISNPTGDYIDVQATIPASAAAPGTKLFARIRALLAP